MSANILPHIESDSVGKMLNGIESLATPLQDLILREAMTDREYANKAAAELLALREKVAEMKKDLAKCFLELSENNSENFADELAEKYFETWGEIRDLVEGKQS